MFEDRIKKMEQEIIELKTCPRKTATALATIVKDQEITLQLVEEFVPGGSRPPSYTYSSQQAIITCTSTSGPMICSCHLKNNAGDVVDYVLNGRSVSVFPRKCGTVWEFPVIIYSRSTTQSTANYTMEITATSDFTMDISYEAYNDGLY